MNKKTKKITLIYSIVLICFVVSVSCVHAQTSDGFGNPLNATTFTEVFVNIANWLAATAASLAILMIIIGGIQYMVSIGNKDRIQSAQKTIYWAVIGLVITLASWGLLSAILTILEAN